MIISRLRHLSLIERACAAATVASAVLFAVLTPQVADLQAALAREYAARHGVGLSYWFSWFGGTVPGHYSVLGPALAAVLGSVPIAVASSLLVTLAGCCAIHTSPHRPEAMVVLTIAVFCNLWSGRVVFLAGAVFGVGCLIAVRAARPVWSALAALVATVLTPTCGAFVAISMVAVVIFDSHLRRAATAAVVGAVIPGIAIALVFGQPGPEGFRPKDAVLAVAAALVLAAAGLSRALRSTALLAVAVCVLVAVIPNGLGSNFQRFIWFGLPVVCVAEVARRRWVALAGAAFALALAMNVTVTDLYVAHLSPASPGFYRGVTAWLGRQPGLVEHRVEAIGDGTHAADYRLLGHAQLARGDETQSDKQFNRILDTPARLNAASYRRWLDDNAVGYVLLTEHPYKMSAEDVLVRRHRPDYLRLVWRDAGLSVYAVADPTFIADAPLRVVGVTQSRMTIDVPAPAVGRPVLIRVRWSRLLDVSGGHADLKRSSDGWLTLTASAAGRYVLEGSVR